MKTIVGPLRFAQPTLREVLILLVLLSTGALADAPDTIAQRVVPCAACHGEQGRATPDGFFPRIAGKPAGYLYNQLLNFRDGRRHQPVMTYMVDRQRPEYLREIAEYFAALDLPYPTPAQVEWAPGMEERARTLVEQGDRVLDVPACNACHGQRLTGVAPGIPGLLGLPRDYLVAQVGAWQIGARRAHAPDCMATIAKGLPASDVAAIATWLSAQPVPADSHPAATVPAPLPLECGSAGVAK